MHTKKTTVGKNFIYNICYQVLAIILPFVTTPYVSRVLGAESLGVYSYHYAVSYYFVLFSMLGISNYGNREIASVSNDEKNTNDKFLSIYYFQLLISLFVSFVYVVYTINSDDRIRSMIFFLNVISAVFDITWYYYGLEQFKITVIRNAVIKTVSAVLIFIFVKTSSDINLYCAIMAGSTLMSQVSLWVIAVPKIKFRKVKSTDVVRHFKPCIVLFIPVIAISIYKYMDKIMIEKMVDFTELGFYENAEKINQLPSVFIMALGTVMLPRVTNMLASGEKKMAESYTQVSLFFASFVSSALCFGLLGVSSEFVPLFLGKGYDACVTVLNVLLPSSIFVALANVVRTQILMPSKNDIAYVVSVVLGAFLNLGFNLLLIPVLGAVGAAIGTLIAESVVCIVQFLYVKFKNQTKKIGITYCVPFFVFGVIMFGILKFFSCFEINRVALLTIKFFVGAGVYLALSYIYFRLVLMNRLGDFLK